MINQLLKNSCVPTHEIKYLLPIYGNRMLELGNKKNENGTYKNEFQSLGMEHISIDWNGEDGALRLDLTQPIDTEPFDVITNFGTTEHVHDQEAVWKNIYNLTKVGGYIISTTPYPGDWKHHGNWYPTEMFFKKLKWVEIEKIGIERKEPRRLVCVRMKRIDKPFNLPKEFYYNDCR